MIRTHLGVLLAILVAVAGCARTGANQGAIDGEVKLDGKLVEQGSILFAPTEGTKGAVTGGEIVNGRYQLSQAKGPAVGRNRVEIRAVRKTGRMIPVGFGATGETAEEQVEAVPAKFNSASTLKVEVKPGDNTANFEVTSK